MRTKIAANGEKETQIYKDFSKSQGESFKDIQISGNAELWSGTVRHEPSGIDMHVVVYGVNSGSVKALRDIQSRAVSLGIEVNTYQEMERGRQNQLRSTFDASKTNPSARATGASAASADLKAKAAARRPAKPVNTFKENAGQSDSRTKGSLRKGTQMITDDDED